MKLHSETWRGVLAVLTHEPALQRAPEPMNSAYVAQVAQEEGGGVRTWEEQRYGNDCEGRVGKTI